MILMTQVLTSLHDDLLCPVLLEKDCTRVVYLLQLSALRVSFVHWERRFGGLDTFPSPVKLDRDR